MKWLLLISILTNGATDYKFMLFDTEEDCKNTGIYYELTVEEERFSWGCFEVQELEE